MKRENVKNNIEQFLLDIPEEKANCIRILANWADTVYREKKDKTVWIFQFDDGAYQGYFEHEMIQNYIDSDAVLKVANSIGWPGLKDFVRDCKSAVNQVIKSKLGT